MESLSLASSSSSSSRPLVTAPPRNPRDLPLHFHSHTLPRNLFRSPSSSRRRLVTAFDRRLGDGAQGRSYRSVEEISRQGFASISSSGTETSSIGTSQFPVSPPPSSVGSPLFWIGVGVAFSALFSWVANYLKKYAMQQAFKSMMGQMSAEKSPFSNAAAFSGQPFPFPTAPITPPPSSQPPPSNAVASQPAVTVDVIATRVESSSTVSTTTKEEKQPDTESKKYAFVDISPEEVSEASSSEGFRYSNEDSSVNGSAVKQEARQNEGDTSSRAQSPKTSFLSVDALEKMMEDPTVQKMVYPYLPEEMRNPTTFKWMLQNPQYRQQLQEMLDNMSGNKDWDKQITDSLKNFDLNSPDVKQQFDQIGLTPEEVISKIMANPEIALSFQNPKVQAAIMDCSENPLNIHKYQNDKEIMDVFNKISELFPGVSGPF